MSRLAPKGNDLHQLHQSDLPKLTHIKIFDKSSNEIKAFGPAPVAVAHPAAPAPAPAAAPAAQ